MAILELSFSLLSPMMDQNSIMHLSIFYTIPSFLPYSINLNFFNFNKIEYEYRKNS
jgi:hypothetical protein